jgi:hypothetical protein
VSSFLITPFLIFQNYSLTTRVTSVNQCRSVIALSKKPYFLVSKACFAPHRNFHEPCQNRARAVSAWWYSNVLNITNYLNYRCKVPLPLLLSERGVFAAKVVARTGRFVRIGAKLLKLNRMLVMWVTHVGQGSASMWKPFSALAHKDLQQTVCDVNTVFRTRDRSSLRQCHTRATQTNTRFLPGQSKQKRPAGTPLVRTHSLLLVICVSA